jgi:hypothetical protein
MAARRIQNPRPVELAFAAFAGHMHLVILLAFLAAWAGAPYIHIEGAAFVCASSHLTLAAHLLLKRAQWQALFFPGKHLSWEWLLGANFFVGSSGRGIDGVVALVRVVRY